jgi:hypothetical protein
MEEKEIEAMIKKLRVIKSDVGDVFEDNNLNMGEVMSLLMSMLIEVALDSGMPSVQLVHGVTTGCIAWEKEHEESNEEQPKGMENLQWLN